MKIGVVGLGVVGNAIRYGFEKLGHSIFTHDIKDNTSLNDVIQTQICFLCVPTPSRKSGACDTSIIESVVKELVCQDYSGVIAIKSTVAPGTTQRLLIEHSNTQICFVPEFLRERCAYVDFVENHDICIVGTNEQRVYDIIVKAHGHLPKAFEQVSPTEAEFCKYFNNAYNATLITFANSFFEACQALDVNYANVKNAIVNRSHIYDIYLDCNESFRGFGGMCLPKDMKALATFCRDHNVCVDFFSNILEENSRYPATVFEGMRKE